MHRYSGDLMLHEGGLDLHDCEPDPEYYCEEFYTNTILTDDACMVLLKMIQKTKVLPIRISEFVEFITCTKNQLNERCTRSLSHTNT